MCKRLQSLKNNSKSLKTRSVVRLVIKFWKSAPTKTRRILTIVAFFLLSIIITVAGILTPLSNEEINTLGEEHDDTEKTIISLSAVQQVSLIFGNNLMICLVGFVPIFGPIFECYVLYSTGVVLTAYITYKHYSVSPLLLFFTLFLFPHAWLEFIAYSTAMAESFWLFWRIIQRRGKREIKNTFILISICTVMLLVAAIVEVALSSL